MHLCSAEKEITTGHMIDEPLTDMLIPSGRHEPHIPARELLFALKLCSDRNGPTRIYTAIAGKTSAE